MFNSSNRTSIIIIFKSFSKQFSSEQDVKNPPLNGNFPSFQFALYFIFVSYNVQKQSPGRRCSYLKKQNYLPNLLLLRRRFIVHIGVHIFNVLKPLTFLKKRLWQRCFPEVFAKFVRTLFLYTSGDSF